MSSEVFVVEGKRTPFGSLGGVLVDVDATALGTTVIKGLLEAALLAPETINEVIIGQVLSGGCGQAPARQAMRGAGIPDSVPALTINKVCGSGLKSVMLAADAIRLGESGLVVAGGMENMSLAPYFLKKARSGYRMGNGELIDLMVYDGLTDPYTGRHMGEIGEASVERNGLTRDEQDAFAIRSYQLAQAAVRDGIFKDEIVPVVKTVKGAETIIADDEEPFKVDFDKVSKLKAVFKKDGTITAGNASTINDGAAMLLLAGQTAVQKHNLKPKARIVAQATESRHPDEFPEAPIGAIAKACARAGLSVNDIDLFEINEAFASVALLAIKAHNIPMDKVNVNGGACAIGHPIGASGARLAVTVIRELARRQKRYGLATLCIGGGEAVAVIFERL
ncbi:MAG: acetyl-CoA C-acyltransferase [Geobacter sp.]|jgi:acetyl-CoA C-acetyltransferase|uniref:thiolase family protein n=1 Tax=Trichlorobacter lovleyi TaxID=313985 RepID=UPI0023EFC714|nr:thiolase family protein [Trichlorobacter lovleyi]MCE1226851.1 thiolase family protein [Geobacteraceae bacterium]